VLVQKDMDAVPCALAWHSGAKSNTLAGIGEDGVIHLWDSVIPSHMLAPSAPLDDALPMPAYSREMSEGRASSSSCLPAQHLPSISGPDHTVTSSACKTINYVPASRAFIYTAWSGFIDGFSVPVQAQSARQHMGAAWMAQRCMTMTGT